MIVAVVGLFEPRHDKTNVMRLRPAWISFSTCIIVCKQTAWILIRLQGCAGWSGSMLVAIALCWFCRDAAHLVSLVNLAPF
jgi:hypothetical protein